MRPLAALAHLLALTIVASAACFDGANGLTDVERLPGDAAVWWDTDQDGVPVADDDPTANPGGPREEVCDGLDNDLDGAIDEDTTGPCRSPSGQTRVSECVGGRLLCFDCEPGDERSRACGCGAQTRDVCNNAGRWVEGVCDDCELLTYDGCGVNRICDPGDERWRRCDLCPEGQDCGTTCLGALYRCDESCSWQQIQPCGVRPPMCDRDSVRVEECGKCGQREVTCDGCFWQEAQCDNQGACFPGEEHDVPCFAGACAVGLVATVRCDGQCDWVSPTSCQGCVVGESGTFEEMCAAGAPECGKRVVQYACNAQSLIASCQDEPLVRGRSDQVVVFDECAGVIAPDTCTPNEVSSTFTSCGPNTCGMGITTTRSCLANGCGWGSSSASGACPVCSVGETSTSACTPAGGGCGTQTRTCTSACEWGAPGECTPNPPTCMPGETSTVACTVPDACGSAGTQTYVCAGGCGMVPSGSCTPTGNGGPSCQAGAREERPCSAQCGLAGTATWQCGGCGWSQIGSCVATQSATCTPGQVEDMGPCPLCPTVNRTRSCTGACTWAAPSSCPVCL